MTSPVEAATGNTPGANATGLDICSVTKRFGSTVALDRVTVRFAPGRVHGLVGENGSGKSTLVKIIAGLYASDGGLLTYNGEAINARSGVGPTVACVYQDGSLIGELTVGQNMELILPRAAEDGDRFSTRRLLDDIGLHSVALQSLVSDLPNNEQRLIEIACVLAKRPDIVLFDESTSTLDEQGVEWVLRTMRAAADGGACVVFVTHRLHEVLAVSEDVAVLRDGHLVGEYRADVVDAGKLVEVMAGREVSSFAGRSDTSAVAGTEAVMSVSELVAPHCGPVSFTVRKGEILGIGGASGNGQGELIRALTGHAVAGGSVNAGIGPLRGPESSARSGIVFVSSDRRRESLFSLLSIRENYTLSMLNRGALQWISRRREVARARTLADDYGLVHRSLEQPVSSLSGGNQQKVAIGRAIASDPRMLLIEEPTEGVDVRSRYDIYHSVVGVAEQGTAVVFTSSDASELRTLADRVLVMARGKVVAELSGEEVTEEAIVHAFSTATHSTDDAAIDDHARPYRQNATSVWTGRAWRPSNFIFLAALILALALYAWTKDARFISAPSILGILTLSIPLALVAIAQTPVLMVGEIDASLGSIMGLTVVALSFAPNLPVLLLLSMAVLLGATLGFINGFLVARWRIPAVIATIATLGIFLGLGRILRPTPGGIMSLELTQLLNLLVIGIPVCFLFIVVIAVVADVFIGKSRWGLRVRAVGYSAERSERLGLRTRTYKWLAFVVAGAVAGVGGLFLAAQTGVGDAGAGSGYTLLSLAVPVIAGALLSGGRGTAIGCVVAAVFIAEVQAFIPFIDLPSGGYLIATGVLTIAALALGGKSSTAAVHLRNILGRKANV